jgi:DNA polymerase eta
VTLKEFQEKLGDASGTWVWEIIRGLDLSEGELHRIVFQPETDPVRSSVEAKTQVKSILASKNFRPTVTKFSEIVSPCDEQYDYLV